MMGLFHFEEINVTRYAQPDRFQDTAPFQVLS